MKKIIVEVEDELHAKFKSKLAKEALTIKEFLTQLIHNYTIGKYGKQKN